jgi:hypothetical protein
MDIIYLQQQHIHYITKNVVLFHHLLGQKNALCFSFYIIEEGEEYAEEEDD